MKNECELRYFNTPIRQSYYSKKKKTLQVTRLIIKNKDIFFPSWEYYLSVSILYDILNIGTSFLQHFSRGNFPTFEKHLKFATKKNKTHFHNQFKQNRFKKT